MWMELNLARHTGGVTWVQVENVSYIYEYGKGQTLVGFVGNEDNFILVKESVDEIGNKISYLRAYG